MPPTLKLSSKPGFYRDDSITFRLSTEKLQFNPQLTSLYMVSTTHKSQINRNCYIDHYISYASKQLAPCEHSTVKNQKIFTQQMKFLLNSVFHLHSDDSNPNIQPVNKKRVHHETY